MPPKKGAKGKGKKGGDDDDAHWEKLAAKLAPSPAEPTTPAQVIDSEEEEDTSNFKSSKKNNKKSNFATIDYADLEGNPDDDDEDGGDSLMAMLNKAKKDKGKKKDKKKEKKAYSYSDDEAAMDGVEDTPAVPTEDLSAPRGAIEVGADDWMEAEFGKEKEKKGKKGKKGKKVEDDDDDWDAVLKKAQDLKISEAAAKAAAAPAVVEAVKEEVPAEEEEEGTGTKVLSKSEKEKIKKEKEKAKKKAQAAAKKSAGPVVPTIEESAPVTTEAEVPEPTDGADAEDGEEGDDAGKKNKNKKKKKSAVEKKIDQVAAKKGGAASAQMIALRNLVEAQKKAAEEVAAAQEAERLRYEEEERRLEEEERLAAEEKARRKEKEKAKRDQLKKEGKLLTPKQKADKAAAEIRLKSFLGTSGVTIEGLKESAAAGTTEEGAPRKVSYAKKKNFIRGGNQNGNSSAATPVTSAEVKIEEVFPVVEVAKVEESKDDDDDVKDDWDASDPEEEEKAEVKDDWDASSEEEAEVIAPVIEAPKVVAPTPKPVVKAPVKPLPKASSSKAPPAKIVAQAPTKPVSGKVLRQAIKPTLQGKVRAPITKAVVEESSSEEESDDDDDDSDEDDSDDSDDSDDDSDESSSEDEETNAMARQFAQKKAEAKERRLLKEKEALAARSKDNMRSPICVILGHVDTGKTKLLDKIRQTNVQEGEAGGITQQIGATYFPMDAIKSKTSVLGDADLKEYKLPGLLVIDTPGHESFTNLRTRGSSLCNIAILVVDIMHGLEPQTLESLRLLRDGKTPFIVALNKIDRLYGWKPILDGGFQESLASQAESVQREFKDRLSKTVLAFAEQGLNSLPYYENKDFARVVSLVPTSAHTGEGVPDMLMLIIKLTQERMTERLMYLSTLECTVLEVKVIEGLGTTIDVVLSNGVLHEGDRIVVCGLNGAISTQIRALLTPQPMKELRIKGQYVHHKEVKASLGIKIVAPDLEKAIAGSRLLVVTADDDEDELREDIMSDLTNLMDSVDKSGRGVCVQASTLGSLEALLEFLRTSKIPVSGINIGPVHRKDVMRAASMLEKAKELAVILCFDVPVDKEAEKTADELGIKIFKADIIYHLFDAFKAYNAGIVEAKRVDSAPKAVWPCKLKILQCFTKRDPIIIGCDITEGTLRVGTPLCVVKTDPESKKKDIIYLGKVTSLEINHKVKDVVKRSEVGGGVAVKIEHASYESAKQFGRHFDENDEIISMVSRVSIDTLKEHFRDDVTKDDWLLIKQLKVKLDVA